MNISRLFPSVVYRRGMAYYQQNKVSDVSFDMNNNLWTAIVHGTTSYFVELNMDSFDKGYIGTYCECPAYESYGSCKHIAAVLISVANNKQGRTSSFSAFDYQTTNQFMRALSNAQSETARNEITAKMPLKIEYYCKWNYSKSTRLNSSHVAISYAVFCLKKKNQ